MGCCDITSSENQQSKKVDVISGFLSNMSWKMRKLDIEDQEKKYMAMLNLVGSSSSIDSLVKKILDLEAKYKLAEIEKQDEDEDDGDSFVNSFFDTIESADEQE